MRRQSIQWLGYGPGDLTNRASTTGNSKRFLSSLQARDLPAVHSASCSMGNGGAFPGVKQARARNWPPPSSAQPIKWNYITLSHMHPRRAMGNLTLCTLKLYINVLNSIYYSYIFNTVHLIRKIILSTLT